MRANIKHKNYSYFYKIVKISTCLCPYSCKNVKISIICETEWLISTEKNREAVNSPYSYYSSL